ncbi:hypothetical protein LTR15_010975 [Elasticomyces elasticus]|nr:hypothetical protein LTR15_010975 [Elasticomyces elasticus]
MAASCNDRTAVLTYRGGLVPPAPLHPACTPFVGAPLHCWAPAGGLVAPLPLPAHAAGAHTVCDSCWNAVDERISASEQADISEMVVVRGGGGGPRYFVNWNGMRALLCRWCEIDEQESYVRQMAWATVPGGGVIAPPAGAFNGWEDQCTCQNGRLRRFAFPGMPVPVQRYCFNCRDAVMTDIDRIAQLNKQELEDTARGPAGNIVSAGPAILAQRLAGGGANSGRPIACRCGRDTVEPTMHPKATFCLCCGGVQVDPGQVKINRHTIARIIAPGVLPRVLNNTSLVHNPNARPRAVGIFVAVNNKRR